MRFRLASLMALLATTALVHAANIITSTGPSPFGFAGQAVFVTGWTQAAVYTNVTIVMALEDNSSGGPIGGVEGTVYLMIKSGRAPPQPTRWPHPLRSRASPIRSRRVRCSLGSRFRRAIIMSCWSQPTRARRPCLWQERAAQMSSRQELQLRFWAQPTRHQPPFIRLPPVLPWARRKAVFLSPSLATRQQRYRRRLCRRP
jgi:hypothetical protein